jgi:hypothetical protein
VCGIPRSEMEYSSGFIFFWALFFGFMLKGFNYFQFEKEKNACLKERA